MTMDYRELENRMARNQQMIKDRAYERVIEEAMKANQSQMSHVSLSSWLRSLFAAFKGRKVEPQPQVELKARRQLKHP